MPGEKPGNTGEKDGVGHAAVPIDKVERYKRLSFNKFNMKPAMSSVSSPRALEKRRRILDAALELILETGMQAATMEAIARQARIAKPTLYTYFPDKFAVFETLVGDLIDARAEAFAAVFSTGEPPETQIATALSDMFGTMADMVENSAHAGEILTESRQFAHRLAPGHTRITGQLTSALAAAGHDRPREFADVILAACTGILGKYRGGGAVRGAIALLCDSVFDGTVRKSK